MKVDEGTDVDAPYPRKSSIAMDCEALQKELLRLNEIIKQQQEQSETVKRTHEAELSAVKGLLKERDRKLFFMNDEVDRFKSPYQVINVSPIKLDKSAWKTKELMGHMQGQQGVVCDSGLEIVANPAVGGAVENDLNSKKATQPCIDLVEHSKPRSNASLVSSKIDSQVELIPSANDIYYAPSTPTKRRGSITRSSSGRSQRTVDGFDHGPQCKRYWQQTCDNKNMAEFYENEIAKLKTRLADMRQSQVEHMQVCEYRTEVVEEVQMKVRSEDNMAEDEYVEQEKLIVRLNSELVTEQEKSQDLQATVEEMRRRCTVSERRMEEILLEQPFAVTKSDIMSRDRNLELEKQQNNKLDQILSRLMEIGTNENIPEVLQSLNGELKDGFVHIKSELGDGNKKTRDTVKRCAEKILEVLKSRSSSRDTIFCEKSGNMTNRDGRKSILNFDDWGFDLIDGKNNYLSRQQAGGALDDLERVKNKISGIQTSIKEYVNRVRELEDERDKLQEELVKSLEMMKRKDEEIR